MKKIGVIGSLNMDLTVTIPRFHVPGETIIGSDFQLYPGGKGGNQAVAAAKLGAEPLMVGCLGDDANAGVYRELMRSLRIQDGVETAAGVPSGTALIEVDAAGENRIVVIPGANMRVDRAQIDRMMDQIAACDLILLQLEIPMETIVYAAKKLHALGKTIILDPAPAAELPDELLAAVDYLTPNETELAVIGNGKTGNEAEVTSSARKLIDRGAAAVIVKLGAKGAMLITKEAAESFPAYTVTPVDTTAAGDSFNAGFAVGLAMGKLPAEAIRFANAVGALSTLAKGAQGAMPTMSETLEFIARNQR